MHYKVFDSNTKAGIEVDLQELTAQLTTSYTAGLGIWTDSHLELCKVYAVLARTDLARRLDLYEGKGCSAHEGYHLCTTPGHCFPKFVHDIHIPDIVKRAVTETSLKIAAFNEKPIKPYYHFRCGGSTDNSENVLGRRITYLRRVLCSYCEGISEQDNEKEFDKKEIENLLGIKFEDSDKPYPDIKGLFESIEVDDQGRILTIKIGAKTFKGSEIMEKLGLESTRFGYTPTRFLFISKGKGHGLGLCQCGAEKMAAQGKTYDEILKYYYTGVDVTEMEMPDKDKVLKGRRFVLDAAFGGEQCDDASGPTGLREKGVNLDIILKLKELLESSGAHVYLTRDGDQAVALDDRARLGNTVKPHFFISLQQNTFCNATARGAEIYHYRNDSQGEGLAKCIMQAFNQGLKIRTRGIRTAELYILREVRVSALLIQLLYISNEEDERLLADEGFRQMAAQAIHDGIAAYYSNSHDI